MRNRWNLVAGIALFLVFAGMAIFLVFHPTRTGVVPAYRFAASHWVAGKSMYPGGTHGFLYCPTFAVLFIPVDLLRPEILGEILWRVLGFGMFSWAIWNLSLNTDRTLSMNVAAPLNKRGRCRTDPTFLLLVLLAIPASLASLHNGQTNLLLSATLVFAALALRGARWGWVAFFLTVGIILKPIFLAPWLLAFAVFRPVRAGLLLGLGATVFIGFLHPNPGYAWQEHLEFLHKLLASYTPENLRVSDLFGILKKAHISPPPYIDMITRVLASLTALWFCWWKYRRGQIPRASWALWVGSGIILTVFNPRAETNSYVLVSPLLAYVACLHLLRPGGNRMAGGILAAACIGLMCDGMGTTIYLATDVWFKPLIVLLVSPLLFRVPDEWKVESGRREG